MTAKGAEHTLEFLLAFNGRVHRYAGGYWLKFEIIKVAESAEKPHGLDYSFTLHGPDHRRLVLTTRTVFQPRGHGSRGVRRRRTIGIERKGTLVVLMGLRTRKR